MTNPEDQNKKQNNTIKDKAEKSLNQQNNQLDNTAFNESDTTNRFNENINKYQHTNNEIMRKISIQQANINKTLLIRSNQSQPIL